MRLAVADDVVEVPAPPPRRRLRRRSCSLIYAVDPGQRVPRALRPAHARHATSSTRRRRRVHLFHDGSFVGPFVYGYDIPARHGQPAARLSRRTRTSVQPLRFFCLRRRLRVLGPGRRATSISSARREGGTLFLLGTDRLGRDMLSRIIYGARISLTVGLLGIAVSFILGIIIGGIAGYYGGWIDNLIAAHHRGDALLPGAAAVDGAVGGAAGDLEPDPGLFRHHLILGLLDWTGPRARRALEAAVRCARRISCTAAVLMGAKPQRDHRPPPAAELHEPPDRLGDACRSPA